MKRKLAKPQSIETVENAAVYACEGNYFCPTNSDSCGNRCGDICTGAINRNACGNRCVSAANTIACGSGCAKT